MGISYEVVTQDSAALQYGQAPSSATIADAVRYVGPGEWLMAVEDGVPRPLNAAEEMEFESAVGYYPSGRPIRVPQPELSYEELKRRWEGICRR
jgi:sarcosine oxidase gamma subunit